MDLLPPFKYSGVFNGARWVKIDLPDADFIYQQYCHDYEEFYRFLEEFKDLEQYIKIYSINPENDPLYTDIWDNMKVRWETFSYQNLIIITFIYKYGSIKCVHPINIPIDLCDRSFHNIPLNLRNNKEFFKQSLYYGKPMWEVAAKSIYEFIMKEMF